MNLPVTLKQLIDWFQPPAHLIKHLSVGPHEGARLCRLNIIAALFAASIIILMFLLRAYLEGIVSITLYVLLAVGIAFLSLPFVIKNTAKYYFSSTSLVLAALIILPLRVMETGGLTSAVMVWYFGACLVFFVIGSLRLGFIAYVCSIIEIFVLYIATKNNWGKTDFSASLDVHFWVFTLALSLGIIVIYWYEKQRIESINLLEEKNQKISSDNNLLAAQKLELENANLDKSTLLNVLSHDITNPLNVILAYTEILQDEYPDNEKLDNINWAATVILQIISHTRLLRETDIKASNLELSAVSLDDCFRQSSFIFGNVLGDKDIQLELDKKSISELKVIAEPVSLTNFVFNNIISNAIKFSEPGSKIEINAHIEDDTVHLQLKDHGTGMAAETVKNLFEVSKISSTAGTQGETGTGLGMKIMASYVKNYGGEVSVESRPKAENPESHGTTFHLQLKKA